MAHQHRFRIYDPGPITPVCLRMSHSGIKVISGGQTGADRAGLDAALAQGVICGGLCPLGRKAEDGPISDIYPLEEDRTSIYASRTQKNVKAASVTLIFSFGALTGGSDYTRRCCDKLHKPWLHLNGENMGAERAAECIEEWLISLAILMADDELIINVAGQRLSNEARIYAFTHESLTYWLCHRLDKPFKRLRYKG